MRIALAICGVFVIFIAGLFLWGHRISDKEQQEIKPYVTWTRLMYLAEGCDKYKAQSGAWPASLAQLQTGRPELVDPWDKDAWGRQVVFVPYDKSNSYGELISYGRDGKVGGVGDDHDLVIRFPCEANTNWNALVGTGLKQPRFNP